MPGTNTSEVWLQGPLPGTPPLLQPVAHALLQACLEVAAALDGFDAALLWKRPAGVASVGFHLQHLAGVLDRMRTYAAGQHLSPAQLDTLAAEGKDTGANTRELLQRFHQQVDVFLNTLQVTDENLLAQARSVGRAKLPSTLIGLLFHAAEHTTRHTGQLLVTVKWVSALPPQSF